VVKPFKSVILPRAKNHNKQKALTELPAFSLVKLSEFCFQTFSPMKLFLIMKVLIFPAYPNKEGSYFLSFKSSGDWN